MTTIAGTSPYTGELLGTAAYASTAEEVEAVVGSAMEAVAYLDRAGRSGRAALLRAMAGGLESNSGSLVTISDQETGIGVERLSGELRRAVFQLRFFADVVEEGSYLEAVIDLPADTPMGPRPDLRRMLVPLGPVAVFGASNFPFAFSVAGGDTASALAAGSPVVAKAHSSHPETSRMSFEVMSAAAASIGAPEGVLGIVYGQRAGALLVSHPDVRAVGFTGSVSGGQALMDLIAQRDRPIPFYGELSSLNPLIVSRTAALERGSEIGAGLAASVTMAAGQLCTKPGVIFVPAGAEGDRLVAVFAEKLAAAPVSPLLNQRIFDSYGEILSTLGAVSGVTRLVAGPDPSEGGFRVAPALYSISAKDLRKDTAEECFGPASLVVRYTDHAELLQALELVEDSLTLTIHIGENEADFTEQLTKVGLSKVGRMVYNGYPTGVAVSWAQTHGGPWPATNSVHTSVGATAIRRFLRPMTWQNAPVSALPAELRDGSCLVPTRINGRISMPDGYTEK